MHTGHHDSPSGGFSGIGSKITGSLFLCGVANWPHQVCSAGG